MRKKNIDENPSVIKCGGGLPDYFTYRTLCSYLYEEYDKCFNNKAFYDIKNKNSNIKTFISEFDSIFKENHDYLKNNKDNENSYYKIVLKQFNQYFAHTESSAMIHIYRRLTYDIFAYTNERMYVFLGYYDPCSDCISRMELFCKIYKIKLTYIKLDPVSSDFIKKWIYE